MTLPLWGQLQKSQESSETIEEAIARIVAEHNAEPEAHLGAGESLEQHKTYSVLDHPGGSVLADKFSDTEYITYFLSSEGGGELNISNMDYDGAGVWKAYLESGVIESAYMSLSTSARSLQYTEQKDMVFSMACSQDNLGSTSSVEFGAGDAFFKIVNGVVTFQVLYSDGVPETTLVGVDGNAPHIYRWYFRHSENTFYVFVDGVEKLAAEQAGPPDTGYSEGPWFEIELTTTGDGTWYISHGLFSVAI